MATDRIQSNSLECQVAKWPDSVRCLQHQQRPIRCWMVQRGGSGFEFWKPVRSACQADRKKLVSEVAGKSEAVQAATQRAKELTEPWKVARFIG